MLRVPNNGFFPPNAKVNDANQLRNSMSSDRSSTSTVGSSKNGDPTVASIGVRHLSPAVSGGLVNVSSSSATLMTRSVFVESNNHNCNNFLTPTNCKNNNKMGTSSSLSSGTGTTSPVSSTSPRLSTCSSTLALNENPVPLSTADRIIRELVETEASYVRDLEDIIIGYIVPLRIERILPELDIECIFSNIEEIYYLNKRLLMRMQKAIDRSSGTSSLTIMSRCFSDKSNCEKLVAAYRRYCSSFAASSTRLESLQHSPQYANVTRHIRDLQASLGHSLPLFAYLLKPVQRILKYQLLWQKLAEQFDISTPEHSMAFDAAISMIRIAQLINGCISLPNPSASNDETAKPNTWRAHQTSAMLPTFASSVNMKDQGQENGPQQEPSFVRVIVMQGQLSMRGARHPRHVILFDSSLVVYKVHRMWRKSQEQEQLIHQVTIPASALKLCELPEKTSNSATIFSVEAVVEPKSVHTFQAESVEKKQQWCDAIRNVILNSTNSQKNTKRNPHTFQISTSVNVNQQHHRMLQTCRSASPFVGFEEFPANTSVISATNNNTTIGALEQSHRRLGSTKSHDAPPPLRFSSVGSSIGCAIFSVNETNDRARKSAATAHQQTTPIVTTMGAANNSSPVRWLDNNHEPHQTVNRTDSEKWRERNRWKCSKSATIDRQCPSPERRAKNNEESSFILWQGGKTNERKQNARGLLPWQNAPNRRAFVRRPSFVGDSHLLRVAQQKCSTASNAENKTPIPAAQETPTLPPDASQNRYSRSNGLRRFFDAVAKRFRSSDRSSKSFAATSGPGFDAEEKQQTTPLPSFSLSTSLSAAAATEFLQQTTPVPTGCQSPAPPEDTRPSTVQLQRVGGKTADRSSALHAAMGKQASCSALLFTPRHSSLTSQQRQSKAGFKKKLQDVRTAQIGHWAAASNFSGVPSRDVFV